MIHLIIRECFPMRRCLATIALEALFIAYPAGRGRVNYPPSCRTRTQGVGG